MAKFQFNLVMDIEFKEKVEFFEFEKESIYHYFYGKPLSDIIKFSSTKIEIIGSRKEERNEQEFLTSRKSRIYKECVSALLFVYYKFGFFMIKQITINDFVVENFSQKLQESISVELSDEVLNHLFDDKDDSVYIPLLHLTEGINYSSYQLEHSWKAFNYIYNRVSGIEGDTASYSLVFETMRKQENYFQSLFEEAKEILGIPNTISCFSSKTRFV